MYEEEEEEELTKRGGAKPQTFSCSLVPCWSALGSTCGIPATMCTVHVSPTWPCSPRHLYSWSGAHHSLHDTPGPQMEHRYHRDTVVLRAFWWKSKCSARSSANFQVFTVAPTVSECRYFECRVKKLGWARANYSPQGFLVRTTELQTQLWQYIC